MDVVPKRLDLQNILAMELLSLSEISFQLKFIFEVHNYLPIILTTTFNLNHNEYLWLFTV